MGLPRTVSSSVQALLRFPSVLLMMNRDLNWTRQLGNAVLVQHEEVVDAVQRMRQKAKNLGYLQTNTQVTITVPAPNAIEIEPANPVLVSVPTYDPDVLFVRRPFDERINIGIGPTVAIGPAFIAWGWEGSGFVWSTQRHHDHDRRKNFRPRKEPERVPQRREVHSVQPTSERRVPKKEK